MCLLLPFYWRTICRAASAEPVSDFLCASGFISSLQARKLRRCSAATCERSCGPLNLSVTGRSRPGLLFLSSHLAAPLLTSRLSAESELGCVSCRRTRLNRRCDRDLTPSCPGHASGKKKWNGFLKQRSLSLAVCYFQCSLFLCVFPHFQPGMNGMEPAFGEAYGGLRGLLSPYPLAMSPQGGRTEYDQVRSHEKKNVQVGSALAPQN